ncbi:hypothetical protein BC834DRAFT_642834 [Gloeopeniophorella convolvens]|nr:hypothetical protein BC834DRAFT_642834 [Gloeopeniophorella convolvens]
MFPTSYPLIASLLLSQATALVINGATSTNFPSCQTTPPSMGSSSCLSGRATLSPRDGVTDASQDDHHRVSVILGACLGAAGGVFLIGLGLFWVFLHHRVRTAAGNMQDVVPRSWTPASSVEDSQSIPMCSRGPRARLRRPRHRDALQRGQCAPFPTSPRHLGRALSPRRRRSVRAESLMTEIVQHHDGGADARIDLPPPYHECLQMQAAVSTTHPSASQTSCP